MQHPLDKENMAPIFSHFVLEKLDLPRSSSVPASFKQPAVTQTGEKPKELMFINENPTTASTSFSGKPATPTFTPHDNGSKGGMGKKPDKPKITRWSKKRKQEVKMILRKRPHFTKELAETVVYGVDTFGSLQTENARDESVLTSDTDGDWDEEKVRRDRGLTSVYNLDSIVP